MSHSTPASDPNATRDRRIKVGVGDLAVTTDDATLTTSGLGSCVAVAIADEGAGVRGLLHAMLPSGGTVRTPAPRPGKYVDSGIDALLADLDSGGASRSSMRAWLVGGAEMLDMTEPVGPRNVDRAERVLASAGIPLVASDVGDAVGRTVRFTPDGTLTVRAADGFERRL